MKYFIISQDEGNILPSRINSKNLTDVKAVMDGDTEKMDTWNIFDTVVSGETFFPDVLTNPFPMFSRICFETICLYCSEIDYKVIKLVDAEQCRGMTYFLPILDRSDCLSERTEYTNSFHGSFKKIVLKGEKICNKAIIRVDDLNSVYLIIRFDLAESILSRKVRGIKLEEVLVDT